MVLTSDMIASVASAFPQGIAMDDVVWTLELSKSDEKGSAGRVDGAPILCDGRQDGGSK